MYYMLSSLPLSEKVERIVEGDDLVSNSNEFLLLYWLESLLTAFKIVRGGWKEFLLYEYVGLFWRFFRKVGFTNFYFTGVFYYVVDNEEG